MNQAVTVGNLTNLSSMTSIVDSPSLEDEVDRCLLKRARSSYQFCLTLKRCFDILATLLLLIPLLPVMGLIAVLVKLKSPGQILYKSLRVGKDNQHFYMYKFRTMVQNAEQFRAQLRVEKKQDKQLFKIENDPRITPLGHILRKYSLDEFPQLFNVLQGHMSLVGPRPFTPDDCVLFEHPYTFRFKATPGMTGLWQVSGRSLLDFKDVCRLDVRYVLDWSLKNDLIILFKTIPAVLNKTGSF